MCRPAPPLLHTRLQPGSRLCEEGAVEQGGIFCVSENCRPQRRRPEQGGIFCVSENCRPHRRWPEQTRKPRGRFLAFLVCFENCRPQRRWPEQSGNREADSWLSLYVSKTAVLIGDGRSRAAYFVCRKTAVLKGDGRSRAAYFACRKTAVLIGDGRSRAA